MNKIELNSTNTFTVYKELSFADRSIDVTNAKIVAADNLLRVYPTFIETGVVIRRGTHKYDKEILGWSTIKAFIRKGIIRPINFNFEEELAKLEAENAPKKVKKKEDKVKEKVEEEVVEEEIVEEKPKAKKKATLDELAK